MVPARPARRIELRSQHREELEGTKTPRLLTARIQSVFDARAAVGTPPRRRRCLASSDQLLHPMDFSTLSAKCNAVQYTTEPQLPAPWLSSSPLAQRHIFPRRRPLLHQLHQESHTHTSASPYDAFISLSENVCKARSQHSACEDACNPCIIPIRPKRPA